MIEFKYYVYGKSIFGKDVLIIGRSFSQKDFYEELYKHSRAMQEPGARIFTVDEPTFNHLKSIEGVRVI